MDIYQTDLKLSNLIDIKLLQELQDSFAKSFNVASITIDDFGPITAPSNFCDFCIKYTRGREEGKKKCVDCDKKMGKIAAKKGEAVIYSCHTGLTDFAVPIIVNDKHIATMLGGQIFTEIPDEKKFREIAHELGLEEEEYINAIRKIRVIPEEKVKEAANHLYIVANVISSISSKNLKLQEQIKKEKLYKAITETIRSTIDINQVKKLIVTQIGEFFNADRCAIMQYDNTNQRFLEVDENSQYFLGEEKDSHLGFNIENGELIVFKDLFLNKRQELLFSDIENSSEDINPQILKIMKDLKIKSNYTVLIIHGEQLLGILYLNYIKKKRIFSDDEIRFLRNLANQSGIALYQAELYTNQKQVAERASLLNYIIGAMHSTMDIDEIKKIFITKIGEFFGSDLNNFHLVDPVSNLFVPTDESSIYLSSPDVKSPLGVNIEDFGWGDFLRKITNEVVYSDIIKFKNDYNLWGTISEKYIDDYEIKSTIVVPVTYSNHFFGVLGINYTKKYKRITDNDVKLAKVLANQAAIALYQVNLYNKEKETAEREILLRQISEIIRSSIDIDQIKYNFVNEIGKKFKADRCYISELNHDTNEFMPYNKYSEYVSSPDIISQIDYDWTNSNVDYFLNLFIQGKEINFATVEQYINENNLHGTVHADNLIDYCNRMNIKSTYNVIISYKNIIYGFFALNYVNKSVLLDKSDLEFLRIIANQAGIAIYQSKLYEKEKETAERERFIANIISKTTATFEIRQIKQLVKEIGIITKADRCYFVEVDLASMKGKPIDKDSEYLGSDNIKSIIEYNFPPEDVNKFVELYLMQKDLILFDYESIRSENKEENKGVINYSNLFKLKTGIGIPFYYRDKLLGVLAIEYVNKNILPKEDELNFLRAIGNQIGIGFYQAKLYQNTKQKAEREALLRGIIERIKSSLDIDEILNFICDEVAKIFNVQRASITQFPNPENFGEFIRRREFKDISIKKGISDMKYKNKIAAYWGYNLLKKDDIIAIDNISESDTPDYFKKSYKALGVKSIIGLPIKKENDKWGILVLSEYNNYRHWTEEEITLLNAIVKSIYVGIRQTELYRSLNQSLKNEQFLRQIMITAIESIKLEETLKTIVTETGKYLELDRCFYVEYDFNSNSFFPAEPNNEYNSSPDIKKMSERPFTPEESAPFAEFAINQRKHWVVNNIYETPMPENGRKVLEEYGIKSFVLFPIFYQNIPLGMIAFNSVKSFRRFTAEEVELLSCVASQSAVVIYQKKLFLKEKQSAEREALLRNIIERINSSLDIDEILTFICDEVAKIFDVQRAIIIQFPNPHNYEEFIVRREFKNTPEVKGVNELKYIKKVSAFFGHYLFKKDDIIVIDNIPESDTPDYLKESYNDLGVKSIIGLPIKKENDKWGILVLSEYNNYRHWNDEEIDLLSSIVKSIYVAIRQAELYQNLNQTLKNQNTILNNNPFWAWIKDKDSRYIAVNESFSKAYNLKPEEIIGKTDLDISHNKEIAESYRNDDFDVMRTRKPKVLDEYIYVLGEKRWAETSKRPLFDEKGNVIGTTGITRDITDRKEAEAELLRRQQQIIESSKREKLLNNITNTIRSTLDINQMKKKIVNEVGEFFNVDRCIIHQIDQHTGKFLIIDEFSEYIASDELVSCIGVDIELPTFEFFKKLYQSRKKTLAPNWPEYLENLSNIDKKTKDWIKTLDVKSNYIFPIIYHGKLFATLYLHYTKEYKYLSEDDLNSIMFIITHIEIALNQADLYENVKEQAEREKILRNLIETIRASLDINHIQNTLVNEIGKLLKVERVFIILYNKDINAFLPVSKSQEYLSSPDVKSVTKRIIPGMNYFLQKDKINEETIFSNLEEFINKGNLKGTDAEIYLKGIDVKSNIGMPIIYAGELLGRLIIHSSHERIYNFDEINFIRTVSTQAAIALYQAKLYAKEKQTAEREKVLRQIIIEMRSSIDILKIKKIITEELGKLLNLDRCIIIEYNPINDILTPINEESQYRKSQKVKSIVGFDYSNSELAFFKEEAKAKIEHFITNIPLEFDNLSEHLKNYFVKFNIKSGFQVPLFYGNKFLGVISGHYEEIRDNYTEEDKEFIRTVANQAGIAIYQSLLYEKERQTAEKEKILREIVSELKPFKGIEDAFNYLLLKIKNIYNVSRTLLIEVPIQEHEKMYISYESLKDNRVKSIKNINLPSKCLNMFKEITETYSPVLATDTSKVHPDDEEVQNFFNQYSIKAFMGRPLVRYNHETKLLGILFICSDTPRAWTEYEITLLKFINESVVNVIWEILKTIEVNRLRDTFVNTLAHDLQVPIVGDIRALEFLGSRQDSQTIGGLKSIINEIINNDKRILTILKSLLSSYEYESGKKELKIQQVQAKAIIDIVVKSLDSLAKSRSINIELQLSDELTEIYLDKEEICRALFIFLENAIIYNENQGTVIIQSSVQNNYLKTCVIDTGKGIPEHIKASIFKRYEMAIELERKIGAGISLYLAKQIVEAHGGKVSFSSESGHGSTFCMLLPI